MATVADQLVEQLWVWGVRTVFGVTGSAVFPILEALARRDGLRYLTAHHEEGAALMASAHAKLTGELGVCLAHAGPGAAHLVNGLYDAQRDGAPVLALTGEVPESRVGTMAKQASAQNLMMADCTDWSRLAASPAEVPELLLGALRHACARQGVAHLAIPVDVQAMAVADGAPAPGRPGPYLRCPPTPDEGAMAAAAAVLARAQRPGLLVGRGASGAGAQVLALAERLGAPVAVSLLAKGLVPDGHPLAVGVLGAAGSAYSDEAFADRDAILVLGSTWWPPTGTIPPAVPIVQVDVCPEVIGGRHDVAVGIAGDVAKVVPALARRLPHRPGLAPATWAAAHAGGKAGWLAEQHWEGWDGVPAHPARVMAELRAALPEDAVVAVDTGLVTLWYSGYFAARQETTLASGRWRTMGFALPAAIAAKLARPERAVVALCGDGGCGMALPELLTLAQHGVAVTVVVLNNGMLGEEAAKQAQQGRPVWGTELGPTDFAAVARACGLQGARVDAPGALADSVRRALGSGRPFLVDVPTAFVATPSLQPA